MQVKGTQRGRIHDLILLTKRLQKQTHRHREQTCGCRGGAEGSGRDGL